MSLVVFPWSLYPRIPDKLFIQLVVRTNLATFVLAGFYSFVCAVTRKFGRHTTSALCILTLTQFHFLFYASRPLPNIFAFILVLIASAKWLSHRYTSFIIVVAGTVVIFRAETALLFGPMIAHSIFFQKNLTFKKLFQVGIPAGLIFLSITVLFDSFMWGKWVWPEGYGLIYNVYLNKSADWGVQPFFWYFYSALPRTLLSSLLFVPFASRRCIKSCFTVSIVFIFLYSFLGHKEVRFIFYCLPLLNTCAADTIAITTYRFFTLQPHPESWLLHIICRWLGFKVTSDEDFAAQDKMMEEREKRIDAEAELFRQRYIRHVSRPPAQLPDRYDAVSPAQMASSYMSYSTSIPSSSSSSTSTSVTTTTTTATTTTPTPSTSTSSITLRKRGVSSKTYDSSGVENVLDEQYSKITQATARERALPTQPPPPAPTPRRPTVEDLPSPDFAAVTTVFLALMAFHVWVNIGCLIYASVASYHNYPGGDAVHWTNDRIRRIDLKTYKPNDIAVHVCNLAAQTGFTRFLQVNDVTYDKSPDFNSLANKTFRLSKYRNQTVDSNNRKPPKARDFKILYFILENVDVNYLTHHCTSRTPSKKSPTKKSSATSQQSTQSSPISLSDSIDSVSCKISSELPECTLVKAINGFDGLDLSRAPKSIFILTVPKLWIFKCKLR